MEAKVHVPVNHQTCHVIPNTNRATRGNIGHLLYSVINRTEDVCSLHHHPAKTVLNKLACLSIASHMYHTAVRFFARKS